jgi:hypothetical protein
MKLTQAKRPCSAFVVLCFAVCDLVVATYPATGIQGVSTNTGSTGNTVNNCDGRLQMSNSLSLASVTAPGGKLFAASSTTMGTNNVRIYDIEGTQKVATTIATSSCRVANVKDPLKLIVGSEGSSYFAIFPLQENALVFSAGSPFVETYAKMVRSYDEKGSNYLYFSDFDNFFKINVVDHSFVSAALSDTGGWPELIAMIPGDVIVVVKGSGKIPILNKADFSQVVAPTISSGLFNSEIDNLNNQRYIYVNEGGSKLKTMDTSLMLSQPNTAACYVGASYNVNTRHNILNFGPYQYVVTIPWSVANGQLSIFPKGSGGFTSPQNYSLVGSGIKVSLMSFGGFVQANGPRLYFGIHATVGGNKNFQSYYLTVDPCAFRTASPALVCTLCLDNYYRDSLNSNNQCLNKTEFLAVHGADESTQMMKPCSTSNCLACLNDYQVCTGCNAAAGYYLNPLTGLCITAAQIPAGYGVVPGQNYIDLCPSNCLICTMDNSNCSTCDLANGYYLYPSSGQCLKTNQFPASFGIVAGQAYIAGCTTAHCLDCTADNAQCTACDASNSYYYYPTTQSCLNPSAMPSGHGPDLTDHTVKSCSSVGCLLCNTDKNSCSQCDKLNGYFLDTSLQACVANIDIPDGFGAGLLSGEVEVCTPNCLLCRSDSSQCAACDSSNSYYYYPTTQSCLNPSAMPSGFGPDLADNIVKACSSSGCSQCQADRSVCAQCNTVDGYYLDANISACVAISDMPAGFGAGLSSGQVETCESNCLLCSADSTACTSCNTADLYFLDNGDCFANASLPDRKGPHFGLGTVSSCVDAACLNCRENYVSCRACDTANHYFLNTSSFTCVDVQPLANGWGPNNATGTVDYCSTPRCLDCSTDIGTCAGCDTSNLYYLHPVSSTCVFWSDITSGSGANISSGSIGSCAITHCTDCRASHLTCVSCDTAAGFYLDEAAGTCVHTSAIPDYKGAQISSGKVKACSDSNCLDCKLDNSQCAWCNVPASFYKNTSSGLCVFVSSIPTGYGANSVTGAFEVCQVANCMTCQANSSACSMCNVLANYFKDPATATCKLNSSIADYFGPNINTGLISPCTDVHCKNCKASYQQCALCDVSSGYFLDPFAQTLQVCVHHSNTDPGFGGNLVSGELVQCDSTGCTSCGPNYLICTQCNTAANYYLDLASHLCVELASIPAGYGANPGGMISSCSDPACQVCQSLFTACSQCDIASLHYLNPADSTCVYVTAIPAGYGGNDTTGIFESCRKPHCLLCQANSSQCSACDVAAFYFLDLGDHSCKLNSTLPDGLGPRLSDGSVQPCSDPNCLDCRQDHSQCSICNLAASYFKVNSTATCVYISNIGGGFGADTVGGSVNGCLDAHCKLCQADYSRCTQCDAANRYFLREATHSCVKDTAISDFYGAALSNGTVQSCAISNCQKCQTNNLVCDSCYKAAYYFKDTTTGQCVYFQDIADTYGADLVSGEVKRCTDLNCLRCQAAIQQCTGCDMNNGYFLDTITQTCVTLQSVADFYGGDLVEGIIKPCLKTGCKDCRVDYSSCQICDYSNGYYLDTTTGGCLHTAMMPDHYGPSLTDKIVELCSIQGCLACKADSSKCQACDLGTGYFLNGTGCVHESNMPEFFGGNLITGGLSNCQIPGCKACQANSAKCQGCDPSQNLFLKVDRSSCTSSFDKGFGPDQAAGLVKACQDTSCLKCEDDYSMCQLCDVTKSVYLDSAGVCTAVKTAASGMGLDLTTSLLEPCSVELCDDCKKDFNVCLSCHENMGYYLEGNLCVLMDAKLELKEGTAKPRDVSLQIFASTSPALSVSPDDLYARLRSALQWKIVFLKSTTGKEELPRLKQLTTASKSGIVLDITVTSELEESKYSVNASLAQKYVNVTVEGKTFRISTSKTQLQFAKSSAKEEAQGAADSGAAINSAMGSSLTSSSAFMPVMMTVVALDPTGVLMKFNQILKIINKLYFININYGTRLTAFLAAMGEPTGDKKGSRDQVYHQQAYRGKLSSEGITFAFLASMNYKVFLYLASWTFRLLSMVLSWRQTRVAKWILYVIYFGSKAHLIIFNLVFIDFTWYGCHSLMHGRGQPIAEQVLVFVCLMLVCLDSVQVIALITSSSDWLYWVSLMKKIESLTLEEKKKMHFESLKQKRNKKRNGIIEEKSKKAKDDILKTKNKEHSLSDEDDSLEEPSKKKTKAQPIDYQRTYEEIDSNPHMFQVASVNLSLLARVYLSPLARSLYLLHIGRTIAYQTLTLAGQYASGMCVGLLLAVEVYKISFSLFFYVKYKYLKNIICLLMEVMQSAFLAVFLLIAMILHPKSFDEIILDFYQDAGIWIVIASCVAEYLLLLTYIGVAAYDFFKNRKSRARALKKMQVSFIKYVRVGSLSDPVEDFVNDNKGLPMAINLASPPAQTTKQPAFTFLNEKVTTRDRPAKDSSFSQPTATLHPVKNTTKRKRSWFNHVKQKLDEKDQLKKDEDAASMKSTEFSHKKLRAKKLPLRNPLQRMKVKLQPFNMLADHSANASNCAIQDSPAKNTLDSKRSPKFTSNLKISKGTPLSAVLNMKLFK